MIRRYRGRLSASIAMLGRLLRWMRSSRIRFIGGATVTAGGHPTEADTCGHDGSVSDNGRVTVVSRDGSPIGLADLRARRDELLAVAARWGAYDVRIFGSVARGEQHEGSDVDVLVSFEAGRSLLDQVHLIDELRHALGTSVDVVAEGGLLPRDRHILAESVPL